MVPLRLSPDDGLRPARPLSGEQDFVLAPVWAEGTCAFKLLANGDYAIGLFNKGDQDGHIRCLLNDAGLSAGSGYGFRLRDVFTGEDAGVVTELLDVTVPAHDCKVYRASLVRV